MVEGRFAGGACPEKKVRWELERVPEVSNPAQVTLGRYRRPKSSCLCVTLMFTRDQEGCCRGSGEEGGCKESSRIRGDRVKRKEERGGA